MEKKEQSFFCSVDVKSFLAFYASTPATSLFLFMEENLLFLFSVLKKKLIRISLGIRMRPSFVHELLN